jgi:O-antigen/teichoic acid export membrane protein
MARDPDATDGSHESAHKDDVATAVRNGVTLGLSLLATWSVAVAVRVLLPRYLGPASFGEFAFAESFAATYFVFVGLGLDTYIAKELAVNPEHASDFFGGMVVLRLVLAVPLVAALMGTIVITHRPPELRTLVLVFALAQLLLSANGTLATMLQARSKVGGLAVTNVVGKLVWGAGLIAALAAGAPLSVLASVLVVSELVKAVALYRLVAARYALRVHVVPAAVKAVIVAALPYFANSVVLALTSKSDILMLEFLTNDETQVGWYSAAQNVTSLAMMFSPVLGWIMMPLLSRAAARSHEELLSIFRRAVEAVYIVSLPVGLIAWLDAYEIVRLLFGRAYAPAGLVIRALAPVFLFTYVAILLSMTLIALGKGWALTRVSFFGLLVNIAATLVLVPLGARHLGPGGGGAGDGAAVVLMEISVSVALLASIGRRSFDRRLLNSLTRSLVPIAVVSGVHFFLSSLGALRLLVDPLCYVLVALAAGAPRTRDLRLILTMVRDRRLGRAADGSAASA